MKKHIWDTLISMRIAYNRIDEASLWSDFDKRLKKNMWSAHK